MKIGFFSIKKEEIEKIKNFLEGEELYFSEEKLDINHLPNENDFEIISIFVDSKINEGVLNYFPKLKMVNTRSAGFDHIDLNLAKKRNIVVTYVPGYGDNTVAEYTFGLLLNLTRKIYQAIDKIKETGDFSLKDLQGVDLKGKILGVIGTGRIGKEVIKIAKGFDMQVYAYDPCPNNEFAKAYNVFYVSLEELLRSADFITIHCPLNEKTKGLINTQNINLLKKGVYLVNTARGGILETEAIIEGLKSGKLEGVALDVIEEEDETKEELEFLRMEGLKEKELKTILENHFLMKHPRVLITPHNAFNSKEALERILNISLDTIYSFAKKGELKNVVLYDN